MIAIYFLWILPPLLTVILGQALASRYIQTPTRSATPPPSERVRPLDPHPVYLASASVVDTHVLMTPMNLPFCKHVPHLMELHHSSLLNALAKIWTTYMLSFGGGDLRAPHSRGYILWTGVNNVLSTPAFLL